MNYLTFLKFLIALGPKLALLWPHIQAILTAVREIGTILGTTEPPPGDLALTEVSAEECACESQVVAQLTTDTALFDGSVLRGVFAFLKANPELLAVLIGLLGKK